jgi:hypothetical protein
LVEEVESDNKRLSENLTKQVRRENEKLNSKLTSKLKGEVTKFQKAMDKLRSDTAIETLRLGAHSQLFCCGD